VIGVVVLVVSRILREDQTVSNVQQTSQHKMNLQHQLHSKDKVDQAIGLVNVVITTLHIVITVAVVTQRSLNACVDLHEVCIK
jgi:hypothetical protein